MIMSIFMKADEKKHENACESDFPGGAKHKYLSNSMQIDCYQLQYLISFSFLLLI